MNCKSTVCDREQKPLCWLSQKRLMKYGAPNIIWCGCYVTTGRTKFYTRQIKNSKYYEFELGRLYSQKEKKKQYVIWNYTGVIWRHGMLFRLFLLWKDITVPFVLFTLMLKITFLIPLHNPSLPYFIQNFLLFLKSTYKNKYYFFSTFCLSTCTSDDAGWEIFATFCYL